MSRLAGLYQLLHHILQLLPKEYGNNGRRSLVCTQSVIIAHIGRTLAQQIRMSIHCLHNTCQNQKELYILIGGISGIQHIYAVVRAQRPVIMLTGAVHACKRLLVQQAGQAMAPRHLFHGFHHQLIVIYRNVGRLINWCQLMLCGSHFVMLGLGGNSQLPQFNV